MVLAKVIFKKEYRCFNNSSCFHAENKKSIFRKKLLFASCQGIWVSTLCILAKKWQATASF
jgi:hypothetical protein